MASTGKRKRGGRRVRGGRRRGRRRRRRRRTGRPSTQRSIRVLSEVRTVEAQTNCDRPVSAQLLRRLQPKAANKHTSTFKQQRMTVSFLDRYIQYIYNYTRYMYMYMYIVYYKHVLIDVNYHEY